MYLKALHFGDIETAEKILLAETPKEAKNLGREVRNFDEKSWNEVKIQKMYLALEGKFSQNKDLMDKLKLVNRSNLGVPRIYKSLLTEGKEPPQCKRVI